MVAVVVDDDVSRKQSTSIFVSHSLYIPPLQYLSSYLSISLLSTYQNCDHFFVSLIIYEPDFLLHFAVREAGAQQSKISIGNQPPRAPTAENTTPKTPPDETKSRCLTHPCVSTHANRTAADLPRAGDVPLGGSAPGRGVDTRVHDRQGVRPDLARPRSPQPLGRAADVLGRPRQGGEKISPCPIASSFFLSSVLFCFRGVRRRATMGRVEFRWERWRLGWSPHS